MNLNDTTLFKPSLVVVILKQIMVVAERILPRALYNGVYDFGFAVYRALLRALYFRHVIYSWVTRNIEGIKKTTTVFKVMPYSLVGTSGLEATYNVVYAVEQHRLSGSIVECGVAQGGSAALMGLVTAQTDSHCKLWLFDSYEGLPEPTDEDFERDLAGKHIRPLHKGACLGTYDQVEDLLFRKLGLDRNDVVMVKGWFQDTLPVNRDKIGDIAVLRIDADWYESTKCCLENLYDNVIPGGYVIIDDYGTCFGAQKATDEFLAARGLNVELVFDGRGGCHFVKPHWYLDFVKSVCICN